MFRALSIQRREWWFVGLWATGIALISVVPYLYAATVTPPGYVYMGTHHICAEDTYSYLAWMQQAREGHSLFQNLYAVEPQRPTIFHPLFLAAGWLARISGLSNITAYHVVRVVLVGCMAALAYCLFSFFFRKIYTRRLALMLLTLSSGIGWLVGSTVPSTDLWMSDSVTFLSIYESPLLLLSMSLTMLAVLGVLLYLRTGGWRYLHLAGASLLALTVCHFFAVPAAALTIVLYAVFHHQTRPVAERGIRYWPLATLSLYLLPGAVYLATVISQRAVYGSWFTVMDFTSPPLLAYLSGFGLLVPLAACGLYRIVAERNRELAAAALWLLAIGWLVYQPVVPGLQRKFIEGAHIPVVVLATVGWRWAYRRLADQHRQLAFAAVVIAVPVLVLSNLYVIRTDIRQFQSGVLPYYFPAGAVAGMEWIGRHTANTDVVLAGYLYSNALPGIAGRTVYFGHPYESPQSRTRWEAVQRFYGTAASQAEKWTFLQQNRITYVVYGSLELTSGFSSVDGLPFLEPAYSNADGTVYRVR
ncbi:MAG: hypothetical protein V1916_02260 [Patescibacteria group bacterium]